MSEPINKWAPAIEAYKAGRREWIPCTWEFLDEMNGCVPPAHVAGHEQYGYCFACGEEWSHTGRGEAVFLFFRSRPAPACRMATAAEIKAEIAAIKKGPYQPKTGQRCGCRRGQARDNCPNCEGTGWIIDFAAIRARRCA